MRKNLFFCIPFVIFSLSTFGQSSLNDLNIIFKHDFENNTVGNYLSSEWKRDWLSPVWQTRQSETDIVTNKSDIENATKALQINFPANSLGPSEGGAQWITSLSDEINEIYFSYDLMYMPDFKFQMGGKLPSLTGGIQNSGVKPTGYDSFRAGLSFYELGEVRFYVYYPDQTTDAYGQSIIWGHNYSRTAFLPSKVEVEFTSGLAVHCNPGTWHNLTYRLVLNTVKSGGGGNYDGILEAYFDGKLVLQLSHFLFRHTTELSIDGLLIYSFFGGSTDDFRNPIAEWLRIDNVLLYTFKDGIEVARGNTLSPTNRTINYWSMFSSLPTNPPPAPTSLTSTAQTKSSVSLKWTDNAKNEQGFRIYRSAATAGTYTEVGSVTANVTTFTDNSLQPGTTYYYKVIAYNVAGNSSYTSALSAATVALQVPAAPTSFSTTAQTKSALTLKWTDNSTNEQGFKLYRSLSATDGFAEFKSLAANTVTFTDNSLQPATTYYYRLRAYNQDGNSSYTPVLAATTLALQIPAAPTGLTPSQVSYTGAVMIWTDKSGNETAFELERSGPNDFTVKKLFSLPANSVSFSDTGLIMNASYQYRVRSKNADGNSAYSAVAEIKTLYIKPPVAPTQLKSTKFTDKSISVTWHDNSSNEERFILSRSLATDPASTVTIEVNANDTAFTDSNLVASTTYMYTIKATNRGGNSSLSNKNVATTLSRAELKRVKDGLVAYYNFGYNPDYIIYDQSGYGDPVNLHVLNRAAIAWNDDNTMDILSNTALVSVLPATKIAQAVKKTNELTFECWIKPGETDFSTGSRIVSFANNDDEIGFVMDQGLLGDPNNQSLTYSVRMQTESTNPSGYPEFLPNLTQSYINLQHLLYVRDSLGMESLYLNGVKSAEGFRPSDLGSWKDNFYLRLGNESDMNHSWKGSYYSVAIYNKALSRSEITNNFTAGPSDSLIFTDIDYRVEVYPNPVADKTTLKITPEGVTDYVPQTSMVIVDMYGKVMYREPIFNPNSQYTRTLDLKHLPQGMYFLQVISGKKQKTTKLIIQR